MKIAYVILHYMAGKDTIECAESILRATNKSEHETLLVIMDNGSTNKSYQEIKDMFNGNSRVVILHSNENLGFAKGNNIGFCYAKRKFKADFIVQLNNDTIVSQNDFNEIIVKKFEEKNYYVLGPDILTSDGYHQNPGSRQAWSLEELKLYRLKKRIRILLSYLHIDVLISRFISSVKKVYRSDKLEKDVENTILHGACLIFSKLYINKYDGICDKTFLYWEEDILKLYADFYGFLMLYSGELSIYHKEDIATNMVEISVDEKVRKKYKYLIQSSIIYSKLKREMLNKGNL